MSKELSKRQLIIQEKKKSHGFRDFLMDIASWYPLVLYKQYDLISLYPETERSCPVVSHSDFQASIPMLTLSWLEYDHQQDLFSQFQALLTSLPFSALYNYPWAENSSFAFSVLNSKNCYLSFTVITDCENIVYSFAVKEWCRNVFSSVQVSNYSENIYQSTCIIRGYNVFFSKFIENSADIWWSTNLIWCKECMLCDWLENASYCIENISYAPEVYKKKKHELLLEKELYQARYEQCTWTWVNFWSTNVTNSNFVLNSENVEHGMYSFDLKDAKNTLIVGSPNGNIHMYDAFEAWSLGNSHFYGVINTWVNSEHVYNSEWIITCSHVFYSRFLDTCSYCLWCIWLRNKKYCILNKQYTKEKWFETVDKIFWRMNQEWILGDYFPGEINPFYFNDTVASLVADFTKDEVLEAWYMWRDQQIKVDIPEWMDVVQVSDLGEYEGWKVGKKNITSVPWMEIPEEAVRYIDPSILKKVIRDEEGNVYRVIKMEYDFLMKYWLPLPTEHWLTRLKGHFVQ